MYVCTALPFFKGTMSLSLEGSIVVVCTYIHTCIHMYIHLYGRMYVRMYSIYCAFTVEAHTYVHSYVF